ncbi:uncharacterized protein si:ch211-171b20.3 isoform X6 [Heptranchias perlo]|uniref:uncharacterized protein si:ch211-171b20.3 isoform X6 n=1 Tax=Heptranchias perlo TaxID=212740 RepID=UPI00355A630A
MSWLDADDDDDYDYDFDFLDVVSEYRPRGPTALPRRVFKVGGLAPSLSPLQPGPGSDLSPEAGLRPPTRHKARPLRDCEKRTHKGEEMYEVEQLRNFLFPRIYQFHTISNLFYDLSIKQIQDSHLQPDLERKQVTFQSNVAKPIKAPPDGMMRNSVCSKEKQECTRRSLKHRSLNSKLFEELPKDQFPFDWSKKNGVGLGGNKVLSSELKRNDKHFRVPTVAQAHGIEGCKAKNVQQLHKEFTYGAPETHTFSSKTHNGLCCSLSFPSSQKLQSYHNPLHGASATFIHRLTEIAGLECDTIRHEKIRKLKKRSDC